MNSFYNTTNETGQVLMDFESKTKSLESRVFNLFLLEQEALTWSEVHKKIPDANEVSLKRSLTNLKTSGKLERTKEKELTKYGRPAFKYKLII